MELKIVNLLANGFILKAVANRIPIIVVSGSQFSDQMITWIRNPDSVEFACKNHLSLVFNLSSL